MSTGSDSNSGTSTIRQALSDADYAFAGELFREYATQLRVDLCFQGFDAELQSLAVTYGPPSGCLLLAHLGDAPVGCVGVRQLATGRCELKRLYVRDLARGRGLGLALTKAAIRAAQKADYQSMVLDTLAQMKAARHLYAALGFREIAAYYHNPIEGTTYFELDLTK